MVCAVCSVTKKKKCIAFRYCFISVYKFCCSIYTFGVSELEM